MMKTLILITLFCATALFSYGQDQIITDNLIEVIFTQDSTKEDLQKTKEALVDQDILLEFSEVNFKDGKLKGLKIMVEEAGEEGSSGSASNSWMFYGSVGFRIDRREGADSPFRIYAK